MQTTFRATTAGFVLVSLSFSTAGAATLTVTSLNNSGPGTLREAINSANSTDDDDVIKFSGSGTIVLSQTLPSIRRKSAGGRLTIDGRGQKIEISGNNKVRVATVDSDAVLHLLDLTISSGHSVENGGGLFNKGNITLNQINFSENIAEVGGGGLYSFGGIVKIINSRFVRNKAADGGGLLSLADSKVNITTSTFTDNQTRSDGGGIFHAKGILTITRSTFNGNRTARRGGAFYNRGTLTVANCTLYGNKAAKGGGIFNDGILISANSTIAGNTAIGGGGIYINSGARATLSNSIIAANEGQVGPKDCFDDLGTIYFPGVNLIGDGSCDPNAIPGDPRLSNLANHGGATRTMALMTGSPAIDAADDEKCAAAPVSDLDQRGIIRPQGTHCDIGAFELE